MRIIGYDSFIELMKATYLLRLVGVPAHVLVIAPPGTAKTTTAKLFARAVGARFVRTTGRYDMLPEDFIAEKTIDYIDGKPVVYWRLGAVNELLAKYNSVPGIWFFDEFDKMNRKSMTALLELMEEQQVTLPTGDTYKLNFMLVAAGNSKKYDKDSNPIPRSVRDRFTTYWELGYLDPEKELVVLDQALSYLLGRDTEPGEQFRLKPLRELSETFDAMLGEVKARYGECIVRAVHWLRTHREVEEPPGPRAYIHAVLLSSALSTLRGTVEKSLVLRGFQAAAAGKITVSTDTSPFDLCREAFERYCGFREVS